jgi:hypothetical protein
MFKLQKKFSLKFSQSDFSIGCSAQLAQQAAPKIVV